MATPVLMPRQGQSVESCILVEWLVAVGDRVNAEDPIASIETDKAVFEVPAPAAGVVGGLFYEPGDDIPVLTTIAAIGDEGEDVSALAGSPAGDAPAAEDDASPAATAAEPKEEAPAAAPAVRDPAADKAPVSPRARNRAKADGVDTDTLVGSGPGGRIVERDVVAAAAASPRLTAAARDARAEGGLEAPAIGSGPGGMVRTVDLQPAGAAAIAPAGGEDRTTPVKGVRKLIATRMRESLASTAQLTLNRSFDASGILAYRQKVKAHGEQLGLPNITINDILVCAVVRTLGRHPALNAHFLGETIVEFAAVNIGVAVDTPRGLMVPVVHGAEGLSLADISTTVKELGAACQSGNVSPDRLTGGTFTVTNLGTLGIETFTPILNAPEVAILGVGGVALKPVAGDNGVEHVPAIGLSLTIDHQAVDGADGARFLQDLATALENFELALA